MKLINPSSWVHILNPYGLTSNHPSKGTYNGRWLVFWSDTDQKFRVANINRNNTAGIPPFVFLNIPTFFFLCVKIVLSSVHRTWIYPLWLLCMCFVILLFPKFTWQNVKGVSSDKLEESRRIHTCIPWVKKVARTLRERSPRTQSPANLGFHPNK